MNGLGSGGGRGLGSLAAEEAALRKGKGRMLAGMIVAATAVVVGLAWFLLGSDDQRVYRDLGKKINGIEQAHFDGFWGCALRGYNLSNLRSNEDLLAQLTLRGSQGGRRYATHVRDDCMDKLEAMHPKLEALIPPVDLQPSVHAMNEAVMDLRHAWGAYVTYLGGDGVDYDEEAAKPHQQKIARAWYDFRRAHADLNDTIRAKLH